VSSVVSRVRAKGWSACDEDAYRIDEKESTDSADTGRVPLVDETTAAVERRQVGQRDAPGGGCGEDGCGAPRPPGSPPGWGGWESTRWSWPAAPSTADRPNPHPQGADRR